MRLPKFTMPLRNGGLRRVPKSKRTTLSALAFSDAPLGEEAERLSRPPPIYEREDSSQQREQPVAILPTYLVEFAHEAYEAEQRQILITE